MGLLPDVYVPLLFDSPTAFLLMQCGCVADKTQNSEPLFFNERKYVHIVVLDSIAVPLFTNSETAAVTPLELMRNFQCTINQ